MQVAGTEDVYQLVFQDGAGEEEPAQVVLVLAQDVLAKAFGWYVAAVVDGCQLGMVLPGKQAALPLGRAVPCRTRLQAEQVRRIPRAGEKQLLLGRREVRSAVKIRLAGALVVLAVANHGARVQVRQ